VETSAMAVVSLSYRNSHHLPCTDLQFYRLHLTMFGALLFLDASVLFIVNNCSERLIDSADPALEARQETTTDEETPEEVGRFAHYALWVASITLGIVMTCMTFIPLLNRNLDAPKTLVINSRLIRMAPRLPVTIFIVCIPLIPGMTGGTVREQGSLFPPPVTFPFALRFTSCAPFALIPSTLGTLPLVSSRNTLK
jgi:hypothetical protein